MKIQICLILLITILLGGCSGYSSPPNVEEVEELFYENYDNINLLTEFLINSNYGRISIYDDSGEIYADHNKIKIQNEDMLAVINNLFEQNYSLIIKDGNTIYLQQWTKFRAAGCGIAYSINKTDKPRIEYLTTLIPLSANGWYYYVDNYDEWCQEADGCLS